MKNFQNDRFFMEYAIRIASRNLGNTGKNPSVGCVITSENKIISIGVTGKNGSPHAELNAINNLKKFPKNTTAYVTLEPCSHIGKNPSCAKLLIEKKVKRVVIAQKDPNPLVNGKGVELLKANGVHVDLEKGNKIALKNHYGFISNIKNKYPEINIKVASYKNGLTIPKKGMKWITNNLSRSYGHILRSNHDAIMVGINTVLADNPSLDCRLNGLKDRSPIKIIIDTDLKTPEDSKLVKYSKNDLIIFTNLLNSNKISQFKNKGINVIYINKNNKGFLEIKEILSFLNKMNINRLLIEGGSTLSGSFVEKNLVNLIYWFSSEKNASEDKLLNKSDKKLNKIRYSQKFLLKDCINLRDNKLEIFSSKKD
jgi:diaminohydroxyphosphoribosylaminopyrimidine deaminase/5-amino-6-(5-phosphoribosylamino)uracil reductase